jgi:hypothetical protein
MLPDKVYDVLKWIALIFIPALATLYATLAGAWNLPCVEQVVSTLAGISTFLGVLLGVSSVQYKKGEKNDR